MIFSEEIATVIDNIFLTVLVFFIVLDTVLIFLIKARNPLMENKYFKFHNHHGFLKITICKVIVALIIIYATVTHQPNSGALSAPIFVHAVYVTKLLIAFIKKDVKQ